MEHATVKARVRARPLQEGGVGRAGPAQHTVTYYTLLACRRLTWGERVPHGPALSSRQEEA